MRDILKPHDLYLKLDMHANEAGQASADALLVLEKWDKIRFAETTIDALKYLFSFIGQKVSPESKEALMGIIETHVNNALDAVHDSRFSMSVRKQIGMKEPETDELEFDEDTSIY